MGSAYSSFKEHRKEKKQLKRYLDHLLFVKFRIKFDHCLREIDKTTSVVLCVSYLKIKYGRLIELNVYSLKSKS